MKIQLTGPAPSLSDLQAELQKAFPQYGYTPRMNRMLLVSESTIAGTNVVPKKDKIVVVGNFGTVGMQMAWGLMVVGLGILLPLIIWLVAWKPKQDRLAKELTDHLKQAYSGT
jgi:hypothetical protein